MAKNVADKAAVVCIRTKDPGPDNDDVTGRRDATAGILPQGCVTVAGAAKERISTNGRVAVATGIVTERVSADGCVLSASRV